MVSGSRAFAVNPLFLVCSTDALLDWDLENLKGATAIGECRFHEGVYSVCNSVWVGGGYQVASA